MFVLAIISFFTRFSSYTSYLWLPLQEFKNNEEIWNYPILHYREEIGETWIDMLYFHQPNNYLRPKKINDNRKKSIDFILEVPYISLLRKESHKIDDNRQQIDFWTSMYERVKWRSNITIKYYLMVYFMGTPTTAKLSVHSNLMFLLSGVTPVTNIAGFGAMKK